MSNKTETERDREGSHAVPNTQKQKGTEWEVTLSNNTETEKDREGSHDVQTHRNRKGQREKSRCLTKQKQKGTE